MTLEMFVGIYVYLFNISVQCKHLNSINTTWWE